MLLAISLTSGVAAERGETFEVQLGVPGAASTEIPVVLKVSSGQAEDVRQVKAVAPGSVAVVPPGRPPWTIQAEAPGFWSAPALVEPPVASPVEIVLLPARQLVAQLEVPRGEELPGSITIRIAEVPPKGAAPALGEAMLECPIDAEGRLSCAVPALPDIDLRLRTHGFASRFFWGLDLSRTSADREPVSLGRIRLRPGGSIIGTVEVPGGVDLGAVAIKLQPTVGSPFAPKAEAAQRRLSGETKVDERGFFSLEGLGPGLYDLRVDHPELAPHEMEQVKVVEGAQTQIRDPIVLAHPRSLKVVVTPAFDPYEQDWKLRILRVQGAAGGRQLSAEGLASAGFFEAEGLPSSELELEVFDSKGLRVASERVDGSASGGLVEIAVFPIWLEGAVMLGDEPIVARLTFRGPNEPDRRGPSRTTMETDADGRFAGYLSDEGSWDVAVEATAPPVQWRSAKVPIEAEKGRAVLNLDLPDTVLEGTVVEESGASVRGAQVTVFDSVGVGRPVSSISDLDGRFAFHGLSEDLYRVEAEVQRGGEHWSGQSEVLQLSEALSPDATIVVRPKKTLSGRVVEPAGEPVPGVWIEVEPFAGGRFDVMNAGQHQTELDGSFEVPLPASTTEVRLMVLAPGFALYRSRLPLGDAGDLALSRSSGTLALELPGPVAWGDPSALRPFVVHPEGDRTFVGQLAQWARLNGLAVDLGSDPRRLEIPLLPPGTYSVCWMTFAGSYDSFAPGTGCQGGELAPGGTLTVRLSPEPGGTSSVQQ